MKKSLMQWAAILCMILFVILGVGLGVQNLIAGVAGRGLLGLASVLFLLIPLVMKGLGLGHPYRLYCVLFGFCILAYDLGCVMQGFDSWAYFDKVSHLLSGIVFTILGYCLYFFLTRPSRLEEKWIVSSTYALFFSFFVAVVWETGEFSGFLLTGHDSQHTLTTGVFDTMEDLIACAIGSFVSVGSFALYLKKQVGLLTGPVAEEFFHLCKK